MKTTTRRWGNKKDCFTSNPYTPFVAQSCSNEEAPSEYYTYASILGKWFAIDSDNSEYYEFFKNLSYVHTQGDSIEKGDFSYNIEESTIFCKPDNKGLYTIKVVHAG